MPGTVKSELLPDADRSHKCDCQEKVSWKRNLPLDKSHFITEMSHFPTQEPGRERLKILTLILKKEAASYSVGAVVVERQQSRG